MASVSSAMPLCQVAAFGRAPAGDAHAPGLRQGEIVLGRDLQAGSGVLGGKREIAEHLRRYRGEIERQRQRERIVELPRSRERLDRSRSRARSSSPSSASAMALKLRAQQAAS